MIFVATGRRGWIPGSLILGLSLWVCLYKWLLPTTIALGIFVAYVRLLIASF